MLQKLLCKITIYKVVLSPILLFLLLGMPDIIFNIELEKWIRILLGFFFVTSIFLIPVYFFRNHTRFYFLFLAIWILLAPIALFPILYFGVNFNKSIMMLVYNTNYNEAIELIRPYIFIISLAFICAVVLLLIIFKSIPASIKAKDSFHISVISFAFFLVIPLVSFNRGNYIRNMKATIYSYYPFYLFYYGYRFYNNLQKVEHYADNVKDFHFHAYKKDRLRQREAYIFVIGETSRYDHWGINGYNRNTSPYLSKESSLLSFKDVSTAGGFTEISVPMIITRATPSHPKLKWKEKSIVTVFHEAGFKTYWITDQVENGEIMAHANEADKLIILQCSVYSTSNLHRDMELIDSLRKYIKSGPDKMFFVLHTLGSHFNYNERYPAQFNAFKPSGKGKIISPTNIHNKAMLINAYDNSILYTDAVLHRIISILSKNNIVGVMLYVSDHGENLLDDNRHLSLHAPNGLSSYIAHVPLFIYTTNAYNKIYTNKIISLKSHIDSKISSVDMFSTLCGIANITFPNLDSTRDIAGPYFRSRPRYILNGSNHSIIYKYSDLK